MLTDTQTVDLRRWAGFTVVGAVVGDQAEEFAVSLAEILASLTSAEEAALLVNYLTPLATLEAAILSAADNLDTKIAGPWHANPNELTQRTGLFQAKRREMCSFLGISPGPALGTGRVWLERA